MFLYPFKNKILLMACLLLYGMSHLCLAAFETQLSNDQIALGDSVTVTYISNDNAANSTPDFSALKKDFRILNTNYGNAINMINGVTSVQSFWRLQLEPKKAGELIIPEINFGSDKSTAHKLLVTANPMMQYAVSTKQNTPVFVRAEINSLSPYVQSQILYTFKLYFRTQLGDARIELPQIKDAMLMQLEDRPGYQTTIKGTVYHVLEKTFAIFPKKTGAITIPPMQFHALALDDPVNTSGNPFTFDEPKKVSGSTKDFKLTVQDIPANYQGTTWLPAKDITVTEQWSNTSGHWESDVPVTRTIIIEAQGLRADQLPDLIIDKIKGVTLYTDRPKRSNTIQNNMIVGVLEQKVTFIPTSTQSFVIPPIKINWWNLETNANAITQLKEIAIQVKAAAHLSRFSDGMTQNKTSLLPDTKMISMPKTQVFYLSIWFWIACLLFAIWIVTLSFMLRKKSDRRDKKIEFTHKPIEMSEKTFEQACRTGQALLAQQYLLGWAKTQFQEVPFNLTILYDLIRDDSFNLALQELEHALYAKKSAPWNGEALFQAFQRIKKSCQSETKREVKLQSDPLPLLNPSHSKSGNE
jgi:hypothetical protein